MHSILFFLLYLKINSNKNGKQSLISAFTKLHIQNYGSVLVSNTKMVIEGMKSGVAGSFQR